MRRFPSKTKYCVLISSYQRTTKNDTLAYYIPPRHSLHLPTPLPRISARNRKDFPRPTPAGMLNRDRIGSPEGLEI